MFVVVVKEDVKRVGNDWFVVRIKVNRFKGDFAIEKIGRVLFLLIYNFYLLGEINYFLKIKNKKKLICKGSEICRYVLFCFIY